MGSGDLWPEDESATAEHPEVSEAVFLGTQSPRQTAEQPRLGGRGLKSWSFSERELDVQPIREWATKLQRSEDAKRMESMNRVAEPKYLAIFAPTKRQRSKPNGNYCPFHGVHFPHQLAVDTPFCLPPRRSSYLVRLRAGITLSCKSSWFPNSRGGTHRKPWTRRGLVSAVLPPTNPLQYPGTIKEYMIFVYRCIQLVTRLPREKLQNHTWPPSCLLWGWGTMPGRPRAFLPVRAGVGPRKISRRRARAVPHRKSEKLDAANGPVYCSVDGILNVC